MKIIRGDAENPVWAKRKILYEGQKFTIYLKVIIKIDLKR